MIARLFTVALVLAFGSAFVTRRSHRRRGSDVRRAGARAGGRHRRADQKREPVVYTFTVDVAEDLAGKFRPTFVKPEHTQPERGSFFVTEGRVFPAGTIEGDGATFNPNRSGHIGVFICRGTHLVAASEIPAASVVGRDDAVLRARAAGQGAADDRRPGRERHAHAHRHRRHRKFRRLDWGTAPDFLGFNPTGGVNLRVTFILRPPAKSADSKP